MLTTHSTTTNLSCHRPLLQPPDTSPLVPPTPPSTPAPLAVTTANSAVARRLVQNHSHHHHTLLTVLPASSRARVSAATATALATISTAVDAPAPSPGAHRLGQRHPHRAAPGSSQLQLLSCHHRCQWATSLPHVTSASRAPSASPPSFTAVTPAPSPASQCFCFQQNKHLHGDCAGLTGLSVSQGVWAARKVCSAVSPIHMGAQLSPRHTLLQTVTWPSCWLAAVGLADDSIRFSPSLPGGPLDVLPQKGAFFCGVERIPDPRDGLSDAQPGPTLCGIKGDPLPAALAPRLAPSMHRMCPLPPLVSQPLLLEPTPCSALGPG